MVMSLTDSVSRRKFLKSSALLLGAAAVPLIGSRRAAAAVATPQLEQGLQIVADRAVIWSRSDRPARLVVYYDVNPSFSNAIRVRGPFALETTDYTARVDLTELPSDSDIHAKGYRPSPLENAAVLFTFRDFTDCHGCFRTTKT